MNSLISWVGEDIDRLKQVADLYGELKNYQKQAIVLRKIRDIALRDKDYSNTVKKAINELVSLGTGSRRKVMGEAKDYIAMARISGGSTRIRWAREALKMDSGSTEASYLADKKSQNEWFRRGATKIIETSGITELSILRIIHLINLARNLEMEVDIEDIRTDFMIGLRGKDASEIVNIVAGALKSNRTTKGIFKSFPKGTAGYALAKVLKGLLEEVAESNNKTASAESLKKALSELDIFYEKLGKETPTLKAVESDIADLVKGWPIEEGNENIKSFVALHDWNGLRQYINILNGKEILTESEARGLAELYSLMNVKSEDKSKTSIGRILRTVQMFGEKHKGDVKKLLFVRFGISEDVFKSYEDALDYLTNKNISVEDWKDIISVVNGLSSNTKFSVFAVKFNQRFSLKDRNTIENALNVIILLTYNVEGDLVKKLKPQALQDIWGIAVRSNWDIDETVRRMAEGVEESKLKGVEELIKVEKDSDKREKLLDTLGELRQASRTNTLTKTQRITLIWAEKIVGANTIRELSVIEQGIRDDETYNFNTDLRYVDFLFDLIELKKGYFGSGTTPATPTPSVEPSSPKTPAVTQDEVSLQKAIENINDAIQSGQIERLRDAIRGLPVNILNLQVMSSALASIMTSGDALLMQILREVSKGKGVLEQRFNSHYIDAKRQVAGVFEKEEVCEVMARLLLIMKLFGETKKVQDEVAKKIQGRIEIGRIQKGFTGRTYKNGTAKVSNRLEGDQLYRTAVHEGVHVLVAQLKDAPRLEELKNSIINSINIGEFFNALINAEGGYYGKYVVGDLWEEVIAYYLENLGISHVRDRVAINELGIRLVMDKESIRLMNELGFFAIAHVIRQDTRFNRDVRNFGKVRKERGEDLKVVSLRKKVVKDSEKKVRSTEYGLMKFQYAMEGRILDQIPPAHEERNIIFVVDLPSAIEEGKLTEKGLRMKRDLDRLSRQLEDKKITITLVFINVKDADGYKVSEEIERLLREQFSQYVGIVGSKEIIDTAKDTKDLVGAIVAKAEEKSGKKGMFAQVVMVDSVNKWVDDLVRIITGATDMVFKAIVSRAVTEDGIIYQQSFAEAVSLASVLGTKAEAIVRKFIEDKIDGLKNEGIITPEQAKMLKPKRNSSGGYTVPPVPANIDKLKLEETVDSAA